MWVTLSSNPNITKKKKKDDLGSLSVSENFQGLFKGQTLYYLKSYFAFFTLILL
jgi:hypothetical protein